MSGGVYGGGKNGAFYYKQRNCLFLKKQAKITGFLITL